MSDSHRRCLSCARPAGWPWLTCGRLLCRLNPRWWGRTVPAMLRRQRLSGANLRPFGHLTL